MAQISTLRRYDTDPSSPARGVILPRSIFDSTPERNRGAKWIPYELKHVPDALLIATVVAHGMPRWVAEECRHHGGVRFNYFKFWCDVQDAAEGDSTAKERVDYCREAWEKLRRLGAISDTPNAAEAI